MPSVVADSIMDVIKIIRLTNRFQSNQIQQDYTDTVPGVVAEKQGI